ncbi:uncharacterized protein MICPUCDRAFT_55657 [Micromonas pusilla CCMP1545]|uniref:Predicted protein n=1 Tax=Micromonas pusilla (strain CCMP1545) TaxID=564608 RepID=C1MLB6_MICPC|nr:uncharacterized protein MICPUCDRAFT_55657 [Micromonas pusilla CCMP1545]EEH59909.1 predicted protein [Micromonas pusilla CCMP1545]|eukprot:XP_003056533.1 predicted protein [Micromonas pusilla CCMP1545]
MEGYSTCTCCTRKKSLFFQINLEVQRTETTIMYTTLLKLHTVSLQCCARVEYSYFARRYSTCALRVLNFVPYFQKYALHVQYVYSCTRTCSHNICHAHIIPSKIF